MPRTKPLRIPLAGAETPPEQPKRRDVHISLSEEQYAALGAIAVRDHRPITNLAKHVLLEYLNRNYHGPANEP